MKTYWDLSDKERAELTDEELARYEQIELMTAGVEPAKPPELEPEPPEVAPKAVLRYRPELGSGYNRGLGIVFDTREKARAFLDLGPESVEYDYSTEIDHIKPISDARVVEVEVLQHESFLAMRDALAGAKAVRKRNREALQAYEQAAEEVAGTLRRLRDDRRRCRAEVERLATIRETFENYKDLSGGSTEIALRFLRQTYRVDLVEAALGVKLPPAEEGAPEEADASSADDVVF